MSKMNLIMLVDEDDIDLMISERLVKKADFAAEFISFTSSLDSLEYLKENADNPEAIPELIFLDINMPEMDGFGFLEEYKNYPTQVQEKCKVVMLSSSIHPDDVEKAQTYPQCIKYMNKPLSKGYLEQLYNFIQGEED